jgi:pSer/pThr/pTyr-binding forkhead associated (FHA) protein
MGGRDDTISGSQSRADSSKSLPPGLDITLEILEGPDKGMTVKVESPRTVIGRKDAEVVLSDPTVSGRHAVIEFAAGKLFITDNHSTNGTSVNGEPVESAPLANMDEIECGDTRILLSVVEDKYGSYVAPELDEDAADPRMAEEDEATVINAPLPNPEISDKIQVVLDVASGPEQGKKLKITHRSTVIGRSEAADVQIDDPTISKKHCQIEIHNKDKMTIKDLASSNGTRLNDQYISAVKIRHGDIIRVGDTLIKIIIHIRR